MSGSPPTRHDAWSETGSGAERAVGTGRLVGRRVVVRSRVPGELAPSGRPLLTDAVGVVEVDSEREVAVRRKDGTLSRIAREDVLLVKLVPPPPPPRRPVR